MIFLIVSILIFNVTAYFIPKRLTKLEMYSSSLFALLFAVIADKFLDLKYNLYGYFKPGLEWQTFVVAISIYPSANIIFLNYYPYRTSFLKKLVYVAGWCVFTVFFEWASIKSGYFYYNGWTLWYSALCYPFIYLILAWNLSIIRKLKEKDAS
ncbi:CBO0543 family protein [Dendrosporobacter sp. 1207_IL3150]|uniref:CBO0543 family protein n=1 Tax=Dendrosporobacter sp. 1207_IL3150 TaxID=3084054 RepID=UPI002FD8D79B